MCGAEKGGQFPLDHGAHRVLVEEASWLVGAVVGYVVSAGT
ncbi:MAG: hypothetical protein OJF52_004145 [Nitrospira sp.]|nr:MAG: hypothetical protein OJF52_004145 [Nitrospira sp.]